ncbi:hypothetical protein QZH41_020447, partial [Actinostola sp. cb2023]
PTFKENVTKFHVALTSHYSENNNSNLYNPDDMKAFADKYAPGLFDEILGCISDKRGEISPKRKDQQRVRTVVILHNLSFFRNQKNNKPQSDSGLYLATHGTSNQCLMAGMTLGFSIHPRTVYSRKKDMIQIGQDMMTKKIQDATIN